VRSGDNQQQLDKIVKKVVFNLHETFKNPIRTCTTQPYCVKESGYGQFEFPIDIYFNGTDTKYSINYYLELPSLNTTQPLCRVRKEIITFINPCPEFRKILIEGGGILHKRPISSSNTASTPTTNMTPKTTTINSATSNNNNLVISTPTNDEIRLSLISPNVSDQIASEKKPNLKKVSYSKYIKRIFDINLNILMFFQAFKYHKY